MSHRTGWIDNTRRNAHTRLKWALSAVSAALTTSFVVILESNL